MSDNLPRNMRMVPRNLERQIQEAEGGTPSTPTPTTQSTPQRTMSQAEFSYGRKRTPEEEQIRQRKLAEKLRSVGY